MELIKFSHVQGEEASSLLIFLADRYRLNVDVTDELVYFNDYFGTNQWEWQNPYKTKN